VHPFDPRLSDNALMAAIATARPTAPHLLNRRAPRALSEIALRLLEKEPEARYPHTGALLQALWEAGKKRKSSAWKAPLLSALEELPTESTLEQKEAWLERRHEAMLADRKEQPQEDAPAPEARRTWRVWHFAGAGLLLLGFLLAATWLVRDTLAPPPSAEPIASTALEPVTSEKGSSSVSSATTSQEPSSTVHGGSRFGWLALWLCATTGLGCPAAQVRPEPVDCPEEAVRDMFEVLKLDGTPFGVLIDVRQPGRPEEVGTYSEGPVVGRVEKVAGNPPELPTGTLLYGRLWTDPGVQTEDGEDAVMGRYTEALLPDGRKFQVCMALGGPSGRTRKLPGSRSGAVRLYKVELLSPVQRWP
jgi:eukaryotic-like serine/threonine-protein kinase